MNFEKRVVGVVVCKEGEPIYSELTTHVRIADESGGEYNLNQVYLQEGTTVYYDASGERQKILSLDYLPDAKTNCPATSRPTTAACPEAKRSPPPNSKKKQNNRDLLHHTAPFPSGDAITTFSLGMAPTTIGSLTSIFATVGFAATALI